MSTKNVLADRVVLIITGIFSGLFILINNKICEAFMNGCVTPQYFKSCILFSLFVMIIFTVIVHYGIYAIADSPAVIRDTFRRIRKNSKGKR